jgi:hypothetical protein
MFADSTLAARIDRAEAALCARFASSGTGVADRAALILPMSGGLAVYAGPSSPINKVIGLGLDTPLDLAALDAVEDQWRQRNEPVRIEMSVLTDPEIGRALSDRGYRLQGFENVLGHPLGHSHDRLPPNVTVETLRDEDVEIWLDIAADAFSDLDGTGSVPDDVLPRAQLREAVAVFVAVPGVRRYLARVDGIPVGEAAMSIEGDIAIIAGAGTLPAFRGRGVQKALLQQRLNDAVAAGCRLAVVTTAPGTRSQDNVMRRGFALLYARAILVKPFAPAA